MVTFRPNCFRHICFRSFCGDTYGGITALTISVFLVMVVSVGMAVDFMRHETYRAELQDALDRGVLAAAAFNQTMDAESTVRAYIKSTNFVPSNYALDIDAYEILAGSGTKPELVKKETTTATASYSFSTSFLKLVGIPELEVKASAAAKEGVSKVEVSMVLDISSSMVMNRSLDTNETRLEVLQRSAKGFLDQMFDNTHDERLTMSLIPFSGGVNVGPNAFSYLNNSSEHGHSHCIDFEASDFTYYANAEGDTTADPSTTITQLPPFHSRPQTQHFNFSLFLNSVTGDYDLYHPEGVTEVDWGWCPTDAQQIEYFAADKETLKARINALRTHEGTGTNDGAKWGAMLLDPTANDLTLALVTANEVDSNQNALPRDYGADVQKVLIIMGDGATSAQVRLTNDHYDEQVEYDFWATNQAPYGLQFDYFQFVEPNGSPVTNSGLVQNMLDSRDAARTDFLNVCETAKDNGVLVFTIGFDLQPDGASPTQAELDAADLARTDLAACATAAFFFDVDAEGTDLSDAFSEIAIIIQKLRLLN